MEPAVARQLADAYPVRAGGGCGGGDGMAASARGSATTPAGSFATLWSSNGKPPRRVIDARAKAEARARAEEADRQARAPAHREEAQVDQEEARVERLIASLDDDELAILAQSVLEKYQGNAAVTGVLTRKPPRAVPADEDGNRGDAGGGEGVKSTQYDLIRFGIAVPRSFSLSQAECGSPGLGRDLPQLVSARLLVLLPPGLAISSFLLIKRCLPDRKPAPTTASVRLRLPRHAGSLPGMWEIAQDVAESIPLSALFDPLRSPHKSFLFRASERRFLRPHLLQLQRHHRLAQHEIRHPLFDVQQV